MSQTRNLIRSQPGPQSPESASLRGGGECTAPESLRSTPGRRFPPPRHTSENPGDRSGSGLSSMKLTCRVRRAARRRGRSRPRALCSRGTGPLEPAARRASPTGAHREKLVAFIPRAHKNLVLYHGVVAARPRVASYRRQASAAAVCAEEAHTRDVLRVEQLEAKCRRQAWRVAAISHRAHGPNDLSPLPAICRPARARPSA